MFDKEMLAVGIVMLAYDITTNNGPWTNTVRTLVEDIWRELEWD